MTLYERGTYASTDRLLALVTAIPVNLVDRGDCFAEPAGYPYPTDEEILELWHTFQTAESQSGMTATLSEFAEWLGGLGDYSGLVPATVVW